MARVSHAQRAALLAFPYSTGTSAVSNRAVCDTGQQLCMVVLHYGSKLLCNSFYISGYMYLALHLCSEANMLQMIL